MTNSEGDTSRRRRERYSSTTIPVEGGFGSRVLLGDGSLQRDQKHCIAYETKSGQMFLGDAKEVLKSESIAQFKGKVQLIFTSPPFPLNRKKKYGNLQGNEYVEWLVGFAPLFEELLAPDGSIVIELGNSWEPGRPVMSPLNIRALLSFLDRGKLNLCQQFICYNPSRLPSPAQWVNVERIRVKDAFTYVWWLSPVDRPKADNRRVPKPYSPSMRHLLSSKNYNSGRRPSEHSIGKKSFLRDNNGAIPPNVLVMANTRASDSYLAYCRQHNLTPHPARMQMGLPKFFIEFLTEPGDIVLDPFAGSNTTGALAEQLGRRWISIEIEGKYATASKAWFFSASTGL
jgi:DNA modification methylase